MKQERKQTIKIIAVILAVIVGLLSLVPIPYRIKDGGSLYLEPIIPLYNVTFWNGYGRDEGTRTAGITVELVGIEIVNSYHQEKR